MQAKAKIMIVDDHEIFRKGLTMVINKFDNAQVIAEASNGMEFLRIIEEQNPDIVFMDILMPKMDGIEATRLCLQKRPFLKIIALSMYGEADYLHNMLKAGASGFLLKKCGILEIKKAIIDVQQGRNYYSKELIEQFIDKDEKNIEHNDLGLSIREIEVLQLVAVGNTNKEIAESLGISIRTVEGHKTNMVKGCCAGNIADLVVTAIKMKIIKV